ncbi:unnamed protein product [Heligmosomoides polygyrus]|uniref:Uncharacterized protein n=1 Tax=Heligmosomoides polygyrus TaxID=6339 RepID=A0A183FM76_HELPZ|nr:unnamed protein product [Heligmosomoides polygyrus]
MTTRRDRMMAVGSARPRARPRTPHSDFPPLISGENGMELPSRGARALPVNPDDARAPRTFYPIRRLDLESIGYLTPPTSWAGVPQRQEEKALWSAAGISQLVSRKPLRLHSKSARKSNGACFTAFPDTVPDEKVGRATRIGVNLPTD